MTDTTYRLLAEAVLVSHQRRDDGNCLCGILRLGESWASHVAYTLDRVGAIRDRPPAPDEEGNRERLVMSLEKEAAHLRAENERLHAELRDAENELGWAQ